MHTLELKKQVHLREAVEFENHQLRCENEQLKQLLHQQRQESHACQQVFEQRVEEMRSSINKEFDQKLQSAAVAYTDALHTTIGDCGEKHEKDAAQFEKEKQKWKVKQSKYNELLKENRARTARAEKQLRSARMDTTFLASKLEKAKDAMTQAKGATTQAREQAKKEKQEKERLEAELHASEPNGSLPALELKRKREAAVSYIHELLQSSPNGVIKVASASCTKGVQFIRLPTVQVSSKHASKKTLQRRNQALDTFMESLSCHLGASDNLGGHPDAIVEQIAGHMRRHKRSKLYEEAAKTAKIIQVKTMTLQDLVYLDSAMSSSMTQKIKNF